MYYLIVRYRKRGCFLSPLASKQNTHLHGDQDQAGVNFTTCLHAAFMCADAKSAKKAVNSKQLFTLLGSVGVKAAHKHVDEIDLWSTKYQLQRARERSVKWSIRSWYTATILKVVNDVTKYRNFWITTRIKDIDANCKRRNMLSRRQGFGLFLHSHLLTGAGRQCHKKYKD